MTEVPFDWVLDCETFGLAVVEGLTPEQAIDALSDGRAVPLGDRGAWEGPSVGVRSVGDKVVLWDDAYIGLDRQVPLRLSAAGRCVSVAFGMTRSWLTVAERGTTVRAFEPLGRGDIDEDDPWFDEEDDPEADRIGLPLDLEDLVAWNYDSKPASLHLVALLTGVEAESDPWDDPRVRWYGYPELPREPEPELPPLLAALSAATPRQRHARLRAGLVTAARILGLDGHPSFLRVLVDGDELLELADPLGVQQPSGPDGELLFLPGDNPRRRVADLAACKRLQTDWEFPLRQRVEPILYPGDGPWPPPRSAPRYKATPAEKAELRLAMACSEFLDQAGLHDDTGGGVGAQLELAVGDRYGAVEAAMLAAPD
jgi:hypothetical protein